MNLLLLLLALETGVVGDMEQKSEPVYYLQSEVGFTINDLTLKAIGYTEINIEEKRPENQKLAIDVYVDVEFFESGVKYDYDINADQHTIQMYARIQTKN